MNDENNPGSCIQQSPRASEILNLWSRIQGLKEAEISREKLGMRLTLTKPLHAKESGIVRKVREAASYLIFLLPPPHHSQESSPSEISDIDDVGDAHKTSHWKGGNVSTGLDKLDKTNVAFFSFLPGLFSLSCFFTV